MARRGFGDGTMKVGVYFRESDARSGGGFTFESSLLRELLERDGPSDHEFIFLGPAGVWLDRASAAGYRTVQISMSGAERAWLKLPRPGREAVTSIRKWTRPGRPNTGLDQLVTRSGVDVLWCLGPDVPSTEVPFLVTIWDLQHRLQPFFPEVSAEGIWMRRERYFARTLPRASLVITGTKVGKDEIKQFYGVADDRVLIVPHPTPQFPQAPESDDRILGRHGVEPGYLLYPAQFWPHKNHITLLHALRLVVESDPSVRLILVGSDWGGNQSFIEGEIARLQLEQHVKILGFVERSDLGALYRGATALTYVSLFGPENLPPLEAFWLGCPVIAADVGGASEQLGGCAVLVSPTDEEGLAEAITGLREQGPEPKMIEAARQRALQRTPAAFVDEILAALDRFRCMRRTWPSGS